MGNHYEEGLLGHQAAKVEKYMDEKRPWQCTMPDLIEVDDVDDPVAKIRGSRRLGLHYGVREVRL